MASTGLAFLSLDAGGPLPAEPGGRRLRASRSLHCMFSVPEHGPAELRHSLSSAPLADSSTDAPGTEGKPQAPRESSFEDLERFLASPEDWPLGEPLAGPGQASSLQEQLKGVVRDIHNAIGEGGTEHAGGGWGLAVPSRASCVTPSFPDRLLSLTLLAFEGLNTAAGKDQCLACIEEAFFPPLWAPLLALYRYGSTGAWLGAPVLVPLPQQSPLSARRSVHRPREAALAHSMERHRNASPAEMGLPSRLFPAAPGSSPAYGAAVEDLRLIPLETCPRRKLDCIGAGPGRGRAGVRGGQRRRPSAPCSVPQCEPCAASASAPRSTAAPATAGPPPPAPCEYGAARGAPGLGGSGAAAPWCHRAAGS